MKYIEFVFGKEMRLRPVLCQIWKWFEQYSKYLKLGISLIKHNFV